MRKRTIRVSVVAVALVIALVSGATAEWTTADNFSMNVAELIELIDRALYLATSGMSGYDEQDRQVLAQSLVNVFEGPSGEHYDNASVTAVEVGIMSHPLLVLNSNWVTWLQSLSGGKAAFAVESLANVDMYIRVAYETALALLERDGGWFGEEYSWLIAYAALLAAKGDADDPLLLPGLARLEALDLVADATGEADPETALVLQARIQETAEAGFLLLEAGVYRDPAIVTRDITIRGESPEETILEGTFWVPVIQIVADQPVTVRLQNLTIRGGVTGLSTASTIDSSARIVLELEDVHFVSNEASIMVGRPTSLSAVDCLFEDNDTAVHISPIAEGGLSEVVLNDCDFLRNGTAVSVRGSDAATLRYCRILDGTDPNTDIRVNDGAVLYMSDCTLERVAGGGIRLDGSAFATLLNNVITTPYANGVRVGPRTEDDQDCGMGISSDDESLPAGEVTGHGNTIEFGYCPVTMRFLLDDAPHGSAEGDVTITPSSALPAIWVTSDRGIRVGCSTLDIVGKGSGGGLLVSGPVSVSMSDIGILDFGNGISLSEGAYAKAVNCVFSGNYNGASAREFGSFEAIACTFSDNVRAVSGVTSAVLTLSACTISGCTDRSAAVSGWCTVMSLSNCTIQDNECAGIRLGGGERSVLRMTDCNVRRNNLGIDFVCGDCSPGGVDDWESTKRDCVYGTVSGWGNEIPGTGESDQNEEGQYFVCYPDRMPDLSFLTEPKPAGT